jgi:hypothetical protein
VAVLVVVVCSGGCNSSIINSDCSSSGSDCGGSSGCDCGGSGGGDCSRVVVWV